MGWLGIAVPLVDLGHPLGRYGFAAVPWGPWVSLGTHDTSM